MYLFHISLHGLIRGQNVELGRDSDTGGQITYVLNLLSTLSADPRIKKLELATRGFTDPAYDAGYGQAEEIINEKCKIVRFFDDEPLYLRKEALWPKLEILKEKMITHLQAQPKLPDAIHAHYADAGLLGSEISRALNIPFIFTGHSLGKTKQQAYRDLGWTEEKLEETFNIGKRIQAEEKALAAADAVIVSTQHERDHQYRNYPEFKPYRSFQLAPGFDKAAVKEEDSLCDSQLLFSINRFLTHPERPPVLAIARPDTKKNLAALIQAYAEYPGLRGKANLIIFAGQRDDIREDNEEANRVFEELFYLIDKYDLYGHIALPKTHQRTQVADIYAYAATQRGIFVNIALQENFGLTLVEAAANGLPVVATLNGGPADIVNHCKHGELVDPCSIEDIGAAIDDLISNAEKWKLYAKNARERVKHFTWDSHVERYIKLVQELNQTSRIQLAPPCWMVVSDIDHTLTGNSNGVKALHTVLNEMGSHVLFAVATGRSLDSALDVIREWKLPMPQAFITGVGSEIAYAQDVYVRDREWQRLLEPDWERYEIARLLSHCPELRLQSSEHQSPHKLSYFVDEAKARPDYYRQQIRQAGYDATVLYSYGLYLDILPRRASKAKAMKYLQRRMLIPSAHVIAIGDSGNDLDMLSHSQSAVVVANHHRELKVLSGRRNVIFADAPFADGAVEGVRRIVAAH